MGGRRSYDDPCGVARSLDLIGERWALLVVRELLLGPKRFGDLRRGLHDVSQNVLSQRLRELEQAGVVRRRKLGPPATTWAYELTERGRRLEPVLFQLARWGSRTPNTATNELSVDAFVLALRTTFNPDAAEDLRARYELRLDGDCLRAEIAEKRLDLTRGPTERPDAIIETNVATLRAIVFGGRQLADARRSGAATTGGDEQAVERFVRLFPRPEPDAAT